MSRQGLDATSKLDGYELNSERGRRTATIWQTRRVLAKLATSAVTAVVFLMAVHVAASVAGPPPGNWTQTLNEEFSANGLNTALWTPEWPSGPVSGQCTSPSLMSQPGNGYLYLQVKAQESTCGGTKHPDTGSLVESNPADGKPGHTGFLYSYGYAEWHVDIVGSGAIPDWPALWSFPENEENEIDTMEGLHGKACHTWHHHVSPIEETQGCQSGSYVGWHTYGVDWEPGVLTFYYDGAKVGEEVKSGYINSTPQYLIMDDLPPGSYGGELVVPDEMVVDYVRVWQHLPIVTTGAATGNQPLQATLNGTVNSNGTALSNCDFDYGTSTSYGSSVPCSGSESGESATVRLTPGTTYHFRIVATNASGTAYGDDETFTTPGPVEAVTAPASGIQQLQAILSGTVNPRGYDAKYHYEYGPTTSYGSSTPGGDAGSGVGAVQEPVLATHLRANTTYHFRLVATSGGVTSEGKDETFTTLLMPTPSTAVQWNGIQDVYYRGLNGQLQYWYWNGSSWFPGEFGYENVMGGDPSADVHSNGSEDVYYASTEGALEDWYINGSEWSLKQWGYTGKVAGRPAAVVGPSGAQYIYYRGTEGALWEWYINGPEWSLKQWGEAGKVAGNPVAVVHSNGSRDVYYRGTDGALWDWYINGTEWSLKQWGETGKVGGDPSAIVHSNGSQDVYYRGTEGALWDWHINGSEWSLKQWGEAGKVAGNPAVVEFKGVQYVYYRGTDGALHYWYIKSPSEWSLQQLGYGGVVAGDPDTVVSPSGIMDVYYGGAEGSIWNWYEAGSGWYLQERGPA